jgi:prephenate dehydrogenase
LRSVAVVGLGLIGASLCRALRGCRPELRLVGVTRRTETAERALADGLCDATGTGAELLAQADLVVICTPVDAMEAWLVACRDHAGRALVTDCGSTKAWVTGRGTALLGAERFLGGHPMAGSELSGYDAADAELFAGAVWVFTPAAGAVPAGFIPWQRAVEDIGCHIEVMDAAAHDDAVAWISHLPFGLSSALVRAAAAAPSWPASQRLAAGGFRDVARLAGGDPAMYSAITTSNAAPILAALDGLERELGELRRLVERGDGAAAQAWFASARAARRRWLDERSVAGRPPP